jgi:hypothetical protein
MKRNVSILSLSLFLMTTAFAQNLQIEPDVQELVEDQLIIDDFVEDDAENVEVVREGGCGCKQNS